VRLRRNNVPIHMEMTPLIDVVFLLLTFFIFALVLMVRADVLDITLPEIGRGESAAGREAIVLSIDREGAVFVEGEAVGPGAIGERLEALRAARPGAVVMISADERSPSGALIELADTLVGAGVREFSIAGSPESPNTGGRSGEE